MDNLIQRLIEVDNKIRSIDGINFRFRDKIVEWISQRNKWILYPAPTIESREEAISAPLPNIWVGLSDDPGQISMGISYQTKPLVQTFLQLDQYPNRETRERILNLLVSISDGWNFIAHQKTRWGSFSSSPDYDPQKTIPCNTIDTVKFNEVIALLRDIQDKSHKRDDIVEGRRVDYQGASFDFMTRSVPLNGDLFVPAVREIFVMFHQCLSVKDSRMVKLEMKEVRSEVELLKGKIEITSKMLKSKNLPKERQRSIKEKLRGYEEELNSYPKELPA